MPITLDFSQDRPPDQQTYSQTDRRKDHARAVATAEGLVIVLANHKGGVTKTTSTANLGAMLAELGRRVLLVDCDPQANLSEAFGWSADRPGERLEDLLAFPEVSHRYAAPAALDGEIGLRVGWADRLRIVPCTDELADIAADLPAALGSGYELRLREVLAPLRRQFDLILLDTPPGLGNLSGMALLAADALLIPALAADLDVRAAGKLYDLVEREVRDLRILGVLLAASERRWRVTRDAAERMEADEMRVLPVRIPRAVRVASAPRHRAPTAVLEPESMVSHAYRQVARLLLEELER